MSLMDTQQQPPPEPKANSALQTVSRFATVGVFIVILYLGWTFYSRHLSDEQAARDLAARQHEAQQQEAQRIFGEGEIKIVAFGIDKATMARGEKADLCYGVVNVTKVEIEPHVEETKPSAYHCLEVSPKTTTTYTITASNAKGESQTRSLTVKVH